MNMGVGSKNVARKDFFVIAVVRATSGPEYEDGFAAVFTTEYTIGGPNEKRMLFVNHNILFVDSWKTMIFSKLFP